MILRRGLLAHLRQVRGVHRLPDVPSVLFEVGYISNQQDAARLNTSEGRRTFAEVAGAAIRLFFARQSRL